MENGCKTIIYITCEPDLDTIPISTQSTLQQTTGCMPAIPPCFGAQRRQRHVTKPHGARDLHLGWWAIDPDHYLDLSTGASNLFKNLSNFYVVVHLT